MRPRAWLKWLLLSPVVACLLVLTARLLIRVVLTSPTRPWTYLVWLYTLGLFTTTWALVSGAASKWAARLRRTLRLDLICYGQPLGLWALGLAGAALAALVLVKGLHLGAADRHAVWCKIVVDTSQETPPDALIEIGDRGQKVAASWQPYPRTTLGLRPRAGTGPIQVRSIETDLGVVDKDHLEVVNGAVHSQGIEISGQDGTLVSWPKPAHWLKLQVVGEQGELDIVWLDQVVVVPLTGKMELVTLRLPGSFQGWALLPATAYSHLAVALDKVREPCRIQHAELVWQDSAGRPRRHVLDVDEDHAAQGALVPLRGLPAFNQDQGTGFLWTAALFALLVLGLCALQYVSGRNFSGRQRLCVEESLLGVWLREKTAGWTCGRVMLIVWFIATTYHLFYALTVPMAYCPDSIGYYHIARGFAENLSFASFGIRTPGYPLFLASVEGMFGKTMLLVVLFQHLALALLAPLTVWALRQRLPLWGAGVAGLGAGLAPTVSLAGSYLMSEALFSVCLTVAFLAFCRWEHRSRELALVGVLAGVATMVRPNGLLILAVLLAWVFLDAWCCIRDRARQMGAVAACLSLVTGYLAVAAPWHLHVGQAYRSLDMTYGHTTTTGWVVAVEHRLGQWRQPINQPNLAPWAAPGAWGWNTYELIEKYPPETSKDEHRYQLEWLRQARQGTPQRFREAIAQALHYNLFLNWTGGDTFMHFAELTGVLRELEKSGGASLPLPVQDEEFARLSQRWLPERSPVRALVLCLSSLGFEHWRVLAVLALSSMLVLLAFPAVRCFFPAGVLWLGMALAYASIGMAVERYMIVIEPLLYIIIAATVCSLLSLRWWPQTGSNSLVGDDALARV